MLTFALSESHLLGVLDVPVLELLLGGHPQRLARSLLLAVLHLQPRFLLAQQKTTTC
jgi:hypothetical protein